MTRLLLHPYVIAAVSGVVLTALAAGWWHYTGLVADRDRAVQDLAAARVQVERLADIANDNAEALQRARASHRLTVEALEEANARIAESSRESREQAEEILSAPDADDGDVAPVLGDYLGRRFGG